ncbi:hypothetical protein SO802_002383 [Lithocarpus litseifolius]|uniref:Neoxanthin synthase n=1 Tax=Lithocarpus litseifolius TaxID=425828 RepID=A0AAW2DYX6_9ROSI
MALSSCLCHFPISFKIVHSGQSITPRHDVRMGFSLRSNGSEFCGQWVARVGVDMYRDWSFLGGSKVISTPKVARCALYQKGSGVYASLLSGSQLASSVFSLGTVAVLPFYTLMVLAPNAELTKKSVESSIPYVVLGLLYAYLLYLSWTPETLRMIFASKYLLPEVFHDGLENQIETRHSVSFCLLFCPIGILTHVITKALTRRSRNA